MPDVFIAYAGIDFALVESMARSLESSGLDVWYMRPGTMEGWWRSRAEAALHDCKVVVHVASVDSLGSREVENEVTKANKIGKEVLVVAVSGCEIPLYSQGYHRVHVESSSDAFEAVDEAVGALCDEYDHVLHEYLVGIAQTDDPALLALPYSLVDLVRPGDAESLRHMVQSAVAGASDGRVVRPRVERVTLDLKSEGAVRAMIVGAPGMGKTTTLRSIASQAAMDVLANRGTQVPVFASLRGYTQDVPLFSYLQSIQKLACLGRRLESLARTGGLVLVLDGLNELPATDRLRALDELKRVCQRHPRMSVIISSRENDLSTDASFPLDVIRLEPLRPLQVIEFAQAILGEAEGTSFIWWLFQDKNAHSFEQRFMAAGGSREQFWTSPRHVQRVDDTIWDEGNVELWESCLSASLFELACTPYMLQMLLRVFEADQVPVDPYSLFELCVRIFIEDEVRKWKTARRELPDIEGLRDSLALLAGDMTAAGLTIIFAGSGDGLHDRALKLFASLGEGIFDFLAGAKLLIWPNDSSISFSHHLLQDYFSCLHLDLAFQEQIDVGNFCPVRRDGSPSSAWDQAFIMLGGKYRRAPVSFLSWARSADPEVVARCILESKIEVSEQFLRGLAQIWMPSLTAATSVFERAAVGRALGQLGRDDRIGVTTIDEFGLPFVEWCEVRGEGGELLLRMSKYLVTNAHFEAFIEDGGYTDKWNDCWTDKGLVSRGDRRGPDNYTTVFCLGNHPRIGVNWYEACAFASWLNRRLSDVGKIPDGFVVRLPTESEWRSVASRGGTSAYPWGDDFHYSYVNVRDIRSTTAVGLFVEGESREGVADLVGNAWEWTSTQAHMTGGLDGEIGGAPTQIVYCGASWAWDFNVSVWRPEDLRAECRYFIVPEDDRPDAVGFRLVLAPDRL